MMEGVRQGAKTAQRDALPSYQCYNPVMVIGCALSTFKCAGPAPWYPLSLTPPKIYPDPFWVNSSGIQRARGLFKEDAISETKITATPEECSELDLLSLSLSLIQVCVSFFFVVSLSSFSNWCYRKKKKKKWNKEKEGACKVWQELVQRRLVAWLGPTMGCQLQGCDPTAQSLHSGRAWHLVLSITSVQPCILSLRPNRLL